MRFCPSAGFLFTFYAYGISSCKYVSLSSKFQLERLTTSPRRTFVCLLPAFATQEGAIALHLAVERYDPARGVRFFTYADWSLRAAFEKAVSFVVVWTVARCSLREGRELCGIMNSK